MKQVKNAILDYLALYPNAKEMFIELLEVSDIYLVGGILREYRDHYTINAVKDIDIIIDISDEKKWNNLLYTYDYIKNVFGGYKFFVDGLVFDVWELKDTWAFREKKVLCDESQYVEYIQHTVFLNMDAIIYDWQNDKWYDAIYQNAMNTGVLDVVLSDNPCLDSAILHSMMIKRKYHMKYSDQFKNIIDSNYKENKSVVNSLMIAQKNRYKKEIFTTKDIERELLEMGCIGEKVKKA